MAHPPIKLTLTLEDRSHILDGYADSPMSFRFAFSLRQHYRVVDSDTQTIWKHHLRSPGGIDWWADGYKIHYEL